jgi:hypothetical protein
MHSERSFGVRPLAAAFSPASLLGRCPKRCSAGLEPGMCRPQGRRYVQIRTAPLLAGPCALGWNSRKQACGKKSGSKRPHSKAAHVHTFCRGPQPAAMGKAVQHPWGLSKRLWGRLLSGDVQGWEHLSLGEVRVIGARWAPLARCPARTLRWLYPRRTLKTNPNLESRSFGS